MSRAPGPALVRHQRASASAAGPTAVHGRSSCLDLTCPWAHSVSAITHTCQLVLFRGFRLLLKLSRMYSSTADRVVTQFRPILRAAKRPLRARWFRCRGVRPLMTAASERGMSSSFSNQLQPANFSRLNNKAGLLPHSISQGAPPLDPSRVCAALRVNAPVVAPLTASHPGLPTGIYQGQGKPCPLRSHLVILRPSRSFGRLQHSRRVQPS